MEWYKDAECAGQPTDIFFPPELDEDTDADESLSFNERRAELARAKRAALKFCNKCKVVESCLQWATENDEDGIWGGTTQRQRRMAVKAEKRAQLGNVDGMDSHGTESAYQKHLRINTIPCAECRRAHARYTADCRKRKAESRAV
jgi:hypothetical protein